MASQADKNSACCGQERPHKYVNFVPSRRPAPEILAVPHSPAQRSELFFATALLLSYPGEQWGELLVEVSNLCQRLPKASAAELAKFVSWATSVSKTEVEQLYVATFDQKRRCCLELSYYATGDTRQRGIALTVFRDLYAAVGWQPESDELPDYLPLVLELASKCFGEQLQLVEDTIASHREGIEILHAALIDLDSPWASVVASLRMALPEVSEETFHKMQQLIRFGAPNEMVGLSSDQLPWPVVRSDDPASFSGCACSGEPAELSTTNAGRKF